MGEVIRIRKANEPCPPVPVKSGIAYMRPALTGQLTPYADNDDGWNLANNVYDYTMPANPISVAQLDFSHANPFLNLVSNNAFGNKDRFTGSLGTQVWDGTGGTLLNYIIDHLTGLAYIRLYKAAALWATAVSTAAALTEVTFSDWRLPNKNEMNILCNMQAATGRGVQRAPFLISGANDLWTSTTGYSNTSRAYKLDNGTGEIFHDVKATLSETYIVVRNHYN